MMMSKNKKNWNYAGGECSNKIANDEEEYDYHKIYVTNMPKGLNEGGLRSLFSKHGKIEYIYKSKDPLKAYAIVTFENPSDANTAIIALNKRAPLMLNISLAHKKNKKLTNKNPNQRLRIDDEITNSEESVRSFNGNSSVLCDQMEDLKTVEYNQLRELQLQKLKIQEAQIQIKLDMLLNSDNKTFDRPNSNRSIMPDGTVIVKNDGMVNKEHTYSSPDLKMPTLKRMDEWSCVLCGAASDQYCTGCGVTQYCSVKCQTVDWSNRHRAICHNLQREKNIISGVKQVESELLIIPPAEPLRRPHTSRSTPCPNQVGSLGTRNGEASNSHNKYNKEGPRDKSEKPSQNKISHNQKPGHRYGKPKENRYNTNVREQESFELKDNKNKPIVTKPMVKQTVAGSASSMAETSPEDISATPPENKTPRSVKDVTPEKKITPKKYLPEILSLGDEMLLAVEAEAMTKKPGFVCLAMHVNGAADYELLCNQYGLDCVANTEKFIPTPGETFAYLNPEDSGWYRARCIKPKEACLIDGGHLISLNEANCRKIPAKYEEIVEFCCQLNANGIKVGDNLSCKLLEKAGDTYRVLVTREEEEIGRGEVFRWLPEVEMPPAAAVEIPRPPLQSGLVLLVDGGPDGVFLRPANAAAQRSLDSTLHDVLLYGLEATPIKEPPKKGDIIVGKYSDGNHYRALCKRTNVKQNKYQLEYIEYGNIEINCLENIYPCPSQLNLVSVPTVVSMATLKLQTKSLSQSAVEYLQKLRDDCVELILSLPDGSSSVLSGGEVHLTVAKTKESVNNKVDSLSIPEWKQLEHKGVDIVETKIMMFSDAENLALPAGGGELEVLDETTLEEGSVSACPAGHPTIQLVLGELSDKMAEYCKSDIGSRPYLPRAEEMCIAQCPTSGQWMRAVLCEQVGGPGGAVARVMFADRGDLCELPVAALHKMLPEFMTLPIIINLVEISGFPENPTAEMLTKARAHMKIGGENRSRLKVTKCEMVEHGIYKVQAPDLLRAMGL